ncbi:hypothetical protein Tco_0779975, partial [Tanacetum coccineum]
KDCDFPLCDDFQSFKTFSNPLFEKQDDFPSRNDESILKEEVHKETLKSHLNPLFEKDEEIISNEASRQISPKVDVKTIVSFFAPIGNCVRKWATSEFVKDNVEISHEVFKNDSENSLGIHDDKEEEIAFLDGLLEDDNFFEINDKKVESFERKTKEDFETKVEPKFKKELQVFHPDIEILNHFETTSYVGSDYVFYEDFSLVDIIFPVNIQGKVFDPGITFHGKSFEKDAFKDKSSKELAPSKALLTLDVFDPLHPPLMDFHVTKAFFGFTFSLLKIFSKKFFEPGIKNATFADIGIFIGYAPTKKAFRIYNRRTRRIIETIHVDFDELTAMASEHSSSGPALHEMTPATISSGLVPNPPPSTPFVPPSRTDWDILFQPMFDELLTPLPSVDLPAPEVIAQIDEVVAPVPAESTGSPSSTTVDQDAPSPSNSQTTLETQPLVIPNDVEEDNLDIEVAHMGNDPKWTKDHPLENIIGELKRPVSTRLQLHEQALFCYYDAFLTAVEPETYKDALT